MSHYEKGGEQDTYTEIESHSIPSPLFYEFKRDLLIIDVEA